MIITKILSFQCLTVESHRAGSLSVHCFQELGSSKLLFKWPSGPREPSASLRGSSELPPNLLIAIFVQIVAHEEEQLIVSEALQDPVAFI